MRAISFFKLIGHDEVICDACRAEGADAVNADVPLHPHHFPGAYRFLSCSRCGGSCHCATETCGTPGCHRLRSARQDGTAGRSRHPVPSGAEAGFSFDLAGQGRFRF